MQKKLIALAIAGIVSAPAFAQSNVTVYGRADYGFQSRDGNGGGIQGVQQKGEFSSGLQSGSRIGFKGAEDLGNGNKAIFQMEFGTALDAGATTAQTNTTAGTATTAATWTNRNSYLGMTGNWGTVVGGRLDGVRYGIFLKYDAFGGGGMGNFTQLTTQYDRAENAIAYISPSWNGLTLTLAHSSNTGGLEGNVAAKNTQRAAMTGVSTTGTNPTGNMGDDVLYTIMGAYTNGPVNINVDYETTEQRNIASSRLRTYVIAGSYNFGVLRLSGLYDSLRGDPGSNIGTYDRKSNFISVLAPVGKWDIKATWGRTDDRIAATNKDASKFGVGVNYNLSKRTNIYADYGKINNAQTTAGVGGYGVNAAANAQGVGYGVRGLALGMAHNF